MRGRWVLFMGYTQPMSRRTLSFVGLAIVVMVGLLLIVWRQPERVVTQAAAELAAASSARFSSSLQLQNAQATQQVLGEAGSVEVVLNGVFQRRERARDALRSEVVLATKTESVSVTVEGEVRFIDDKAFLYIKKSPPIFGLLSQLKGQWLELPRGQEVAQSEQAGAGKPFTDVKRIGTEELDGKNVVKYEAVATEAAVVHMMDSIAELLGTRLTGDQITTIRQSVQQVGKVPVELWIGRWGSNLEKLSAVLDIPGGNQVRFTLVIHERNQKVTIDTPAGAVSVESAIKASAQVTPTPTAR